MDQIEHGDTFIISESDSTSHQVYSKDLKQVVRSLYW